MTISRERSRHRFRVTKKPTTVASDILFKHAPLDVQRLEKSGRKLERLRKRREYKEKYLIPNGR